jgi:hypothetical protein
MCNGQIGRVDGGDGIGGVSRNKDQGHGLKLQLAQAR